MKRKILIITISYIIGVIWGLYFNNIISILFFLAFFIYGLISKKKILILVILVCFFSNLYMKIIINRFEKMYKNATNICVQGIVINEYKQTDYYNSYIIKISKPEKYKNTRLIVKLKKNEKIEFGDKIIVKGDFEEAEKNRNYKGFNYNNYLRSKNIYGILNNNKYEIIQKKSINKYNLVLHNFYNICKQKIYTYLPENVANICCALILGDKSNIDSDIIDDFSNCNLSHILAVSGMHLTYIVSIILLFFSKFSKKAKNIILIITVFIFCNLVGNSESVIRASIMTSLYFISQLIHRKSDNIINLSISSLIILIINPYSIISLSFILSTMGTLGILLFNKIISFKFEQIGILNKNKITEYIKNSISLSISANILIIPVIILIYHKFSLIFIISNLIANILISIIMPVLILFLIISFFSIFLSNKISYILSLCVNILLFFVNFISNFKFANIIVCRPYLISIFIYYFTCFIQYKKFRSKDEIKKKLNNLLGKICSVYLIVIIAINIYNRFDSNLYIHFVDVGQGDCTFIKFKNKNILIDGGGNELGDFGKKENNTNLNNRLTYNKNNTKINKKNIDNNTENNIKNNTKNNTKINIKTLHSKYNNSNEKIEIDDYVGKNILFPYLLNRKVTKIDYMVISHFDSDHCKGLLYIMDKIKIKNIIIGKQFENSKNYKDFVNIAKQKNINVKIAKIDEKIYIDKNLYFDILWPSEKNVISDNCINNNSVVCKLNYKNFSMLFTGDIEKIAEQVIVDLYGKNNKDNLNNKNLDYKSSNIAQNLNTKRANTEILQKKSKIFKNQNYFILNKKNQKCKLNSTILKVGHHGSKTSTTDDFLNLVNPDLAMIGVGKNNKFGHPADEIIEKLQNNNIKIFRTDQMGEITIKTNGNKLYFCEQMKKDD